MACWEAAACRRVVGDAGGIMPIVCPMVVPGSVTGPATKVVTRIPAVRSLVLAFAIRRASRDHRPMPTLRGVRRGLVSGEKR